MDASRRSFVRGLAGIPIATGMAGAPLLSAAFRAADVTGLLQQIQQQYGRFDHAAWCRLLGAANEYKEGDEILGVAAASEQARQQARQLLAQTTLGDVDAHPLLVDQLHQTIVQSIDAQLQTQLADWTFAALKKFLLTSTEEAIRSVMPGLSSDVIGCLVKLCSNQELIELGGKIFNPLPGSSIGARGYLGARIQPNSPTDHPDDIRWQVFNGWAYAVGDVLLGTNPVSSETESVLQVEQTLQEILHAFDLQHILPHCVLSHIDVQAAAEKAQPGSTELWFQSIGGCDSANQTFDISVDSMLRHAATRSGRFGMYFETGQGADFTNGHGHGFDMVLHESRKYGFARALSQRVSAARLAAGNTAATWMHLNDVAGFIGPEVFRSREQLVRCCLEDIVMGKLHGLCIGLDVCSTLHMDVTLEDLDWCLDQILPAHPAYLMALPTKIDPMLGYLTTGYQDHVRLRQKFGRRVDDRMWTFFTTLGVIDEAGHPTQHFGDPLWVYQQYCRRKGDVRGDEQILADGRSQMQQVRDRGVFLVEGSGADAGELAPQYAARIRSIYDDARKSIFAEFPAGFASTIPNALPISTRSKNREDYILHPQSGELLSPDSEQKLLQLRKLLPETCDVQIMISDGLNALSITDAAQLQPFLRELQARLEQASFQVSATPLVLSSGRVRAGYRSGETLFGGLPGRKALLHIIGERPGTGHRTFSVYLTAAIGADWQVRNRIDHDRTRVVAGIANTALRPQQAALDTVRILKQLWNDLPDD